MSKKVMRNKSKIKILKGSLKITQKSALNFKKFKRRKLIKTVKLVRIYT